MRDPEGVFGAQAIAAYEAANPDGNPWTYLPPGEWGRWNAVVIAVLAVPSNQKDRLRELEQRVAQLTRERDEWAAKWMAERRKYAELRWPGMTRTVKPTDSGANTQPPAKGQCPPPPERRDVSPQVNPGGSDVR